MCLRFPIHGRRLVCFEVRDQSLIDHYYLRRGARSDVQCVPVRNRHANQISRDRWCGSGSTIRVRDVP